MSDVDTRCPGSGSARAAATGLPLVMALGLSVACGLGGEPDRQPGRAGAPDLDAAATGLQPAPPAPGDGQVGSERVGAPPDSAGRRATLVGPDTIRPVPSFRLDGRLDEWRDLPPAYELPGEPGGAAGVAWVGLVDAGLAFAGEYPETPGRAGGRLDGAMGSEASGDPVLSVHLTDGTAPELPPVGWGHQFGFETLEGEDDCADLADLEADLECRAWFAAQQDYRPRLERLLRRSWVVAVGDIREVAASEASGELPEDARAKAARLQRSSVAAVTWSDPGGSRPTVEILVPWEAFPPIQGLELSRLRVALDVGEASGAPDRWDVLHLAVPREHFLTPCRYGLENVLIDLGPSIARRHPSPDALYFVAPTASPDVRSLLVVDHEAAGYLYLPDASTVSPAVYEATFFVRWLDGGDRVCGPVIAYGHGEAVSATAELTRRGGELWRDGLDHVLDSVEVRTRRLPGGDWLVMEGPAISYSAFGSGQCGACPRVTLEVYRLARDPTRVVPLFGYHNVDQWSGDDEAGIEVQVSSRWDTISVYEGWLDFDAGPETPRWRLERHCLSPTADRYELCERREPVPAPERRMWEGRRVP